MSDPSTSSVFSDSPDEDDVVRYRSVSVSAIVAMLLACASAMAILGPLFWILPVLAAAVAGISLWQISRSEPRPIGHGLAQAALFVSILFMIAAPTRYFLRQQRVQAQAQVVADEWFRMISRQQFAKALEASRPPAQRAPLDKKLNELYQTNPDLRDRLTDFVDNPSKPLVRTLSILMNRRAEARFYELLGHTTHGGEDSLDVVYAITFREPNPEGGSPLKKSFFVRLNLIRQDDPTSARGLWQVMHHDKPYKP